jgi:hypothetical protein
MAGLTKVTAGVIAANAVVDSFGTQSITGDKLGLGAINANNIVTGAVTGDKLGATAINANNIVDGTITNAKIDTVANTKLTGTITATQMAANSVNSTILQTNSVENYIADSGRPLSNRNLIINGAMQVAQRNTSVTGITSDGYYTADRWILGLSSAGTWTMNVESSGPTNTEFRKSANVICTTADSSLAASDVARFLQRIEGQNLQGIKKGTSAAESLTLSFYVKSSNTGTYICELFDNDNTRQISKSYTIDTANTWEKKTITIPPDTTGLFDNDNGTSLQLNFWLAAGTTFSSGTLNDTAWASVTNANRAAGQLNLANAVGNYWAVTGIQLETGTVATPFEMRSIGQELALCQRYFQKVKGGFGAPSDTTQMSFGVFFAPTMRATPSFTGVGVVNATDFFATNSSSASNPTITINVATIDGGNIYHGSWTGLVTNRFFGVESYGNGSTTGIFANAEL